MVHFFPPRIYVHVCKHKWIDVNLTSFIHSPDVWLGKETLDAADVVFLEQSEIIGNYINFIQVRIRQ